MVAIKKIFGDEIRKEMVYEKIKIIY